MRPMGMTLIFEYSRPKVTLTVDHTHGVDQGFSWSNCCISEWEGRLTLNKGGGSRSFRIKTVTIWCPRSGDRIYHIVTGMTSDIGVPSTRLVIIVVVLVYLIAFVFACRKRYWGYGWLSFSHMSTASKQCNYDNRNKICRNSRWNLSYKMKYKSVRMK